LAKVTTRRRRILATGVFALFLMPMLIGCGGQPTAESPQRFCSPESTRAACSSARVGVEYELSLYTHCGVGHTYFDGRYWIIEPTQPHAGNHVDGVIQLVTKNLAHFRGEGLQFAFEPAPSSFAPPPCY
jgi:hypothetical protein